MLTARPEPSDLRCCFHCVAAPLPWPDAPGATRLPPAHRRRSNLPPALERQRPRQVRNDRLGQGSSPYRAATSRKVTLPGMERHFTDGALRTMAFNTMVRVTNLTNGKTVVVRITDRGSFVDNRIIDLSRAAAQAIESIGPGVVPVRLEVISGGDPFGGFFTVQVGAFRDAGNAQRLRDRLNVLYPPAFIQQVQLDDGTFYRVRVGRISGAPSAQRFAEDVRAKEGLHSMVVRLDEDAPAGGGSQ